MADIVIDSEHSVARPICWTNIPEHQTAVDTGRQITQVYLTSQINLLFAFNQIEDLASQF